MYILIDSRDGEVVKSDDSFEAITEAALKMNSSSKDHPSYRCWEILSEKEPRYVGRLWRAFGCGFNKENPWNADKAEMPF